MKRREFISSTLMLALGARALAGAPPAAVRAPAVGQRWRYARHDLYSGELHDVEVERVVSVGRSIDIASSIEQGASESRAAPSWSAPWLERYRPRHAAAPVPGEVQSPWGMVLVDPHWRRVQVFEHPIPLWPARLEPGWSTHFVTRYATPDHLEGLRWDQTMHAHAWESLSVPAGRFDTLRFTNLIRFDDVDSSRSDCEREETVWLAPSVGRWVARESRGSYVLADSINVQPYQESAWRWELLSFA